MSQREERRRGGGLWKCCCKREVADTGLTARGKHNHAAEAGALDHATGVGFRPDKSTTKAFFRLMKNVHYYLRGEVPPPEVCRETV